MRRLAQDEARALAAALPALERALLLSLLPRDAADSRGALLEVRSGTGGEEACLFAGELFRMYERYAAARGWRFEVAEMSESDLGGCRLASATVSAAGGGGGVYGRLKFESGVHRVQRVPATESGGRLHTSAASVVVLPEADEVDVEVRDEDLRIDVYRAGGAGGQHVNTTNSAVRVTHLPTGLAVCIQDERSQHKNKAKALKVLRARLADAARRAAAAAQSAERRGQAGSGDRSERVRTYNFAAGRVTDHRVGVTEHGMEAVMGGERLDAFVDALRLQHQADLLAALGTGGAGR
jgi:peptide chain release factor 1